MTDLKDEHKNTTEDYNIADLLRAYHIIDDTTIEEPAINENRSKFEEPFGEVAHFENIVQDIDQALISVDMLEAPVSTPEAEDELTDINPTLPETPWSLWSLDRNHLADDKRADFWSPWLLILVGILGGSILTLLILQGLNGTLTFNDTTTIDRLQNQIIALNHQVNLQSEAVDTTLNSLNNQISSLEQNRVSETEASVHQLQQALSTIELRATELATQVDTLEKTMTELVIASEANSNTQLLQNELTTIQTKITSLNLSNKDISTTLKTLQDDVDQYNALFITLRELLLTLEEPASIVDSEN